MAYKIAVASTDGKFINEHFGRATQFLIFQVTEGKYIYQESLKTQPYCMQGEHDEHQLKSASEVLTGCRAVLVSRIGSGAAEILERQGIQALEVQDYIEDALVKIIHYYSKLDNRQTTHP